MKKVFVVCKCIGDKESFLFKVKDAYYWTYGFRQASQFGSNEEAGQALNNVPGDTVGDYFRIIPVYVKA